MKRLRLKAIQIIAEKALAPMCENLDRPTYAYIKAVKTKVIVHLRPAKANERQWRFTANEYLVKLNKFQSKIN